MERLRKFTDKAVEPAQSKQQRENRLKRHRASEDRQNSHLITRDLSREGFQAAKRCKEQWLTTPESGEDKARRHSD